MKKFSLYFLRCALWSSLFLVNYQLQGMEQEAAAHLDDDASYRPLGLMNLIETKADSPYCIKHLLLAGVNPDAQDRYGRTALMIAAQKCRLGTMQILLNPSNVWYDTLAEQWPDAPLEICKFACTFAPSADPNLTDKFGKTALHYTLLANWEKQYGKGYEDLKYKAVKLLIDAGADVNAEIQEASLIEDIMLLTNPDVAINRVEKISSPLIEAVRRGEVTIVRLLLDAGANPFALTTDYQTALDIATSDVIISLLIEAETKWLKEHPDFYPTTEKYKSMGRPRGDWTRSPQGPHWDGD
jgi:ankyrin repeat protein